MQTNFFQYIDNEPDAKSSFACLGSLADFAMGAMAPILKAVFFCVIRPRSDRDQTAIFCVIGRRFGQAAFRLWWRIRATVVPLAPV
jgi:hypothetical protein